MNRVALLVVLDQLHSLSVRERGKAKETELLIANLWPQIVLDLHLRALHLVVATRNDSSEPLLAVPALLACIS